MIIKKINFCHSEGGTTEESLQELKFYARCDRGHMLLKILRYAQKSKIRRSQ